MSLSDNGALTSDVRFEGVEKHFGSVVALHQLDLNIPRGTFFSLLGPSGCGKTTTLRLIAGFEQPNRGEIFIREKQVTRLPAYKRNFGMVFQNFALFPHLSVAENVAFGLQMRKVGREAAAKKVADTLELVALGGYGDRYPRQLSGGQQQRVALARAIVFEPDVLLLDEPLGALDKMLREQMQVELRQLQRRVGTTTVFVTHDQEEALTMSDLVSVMKDGRIEQAGAPQEIYEQPNNEFVATFLGASNILHGVVKSRNGSEMAVEVAGSSLVLPAGQHQVGEHVTLALRPEKVKVRQPGRVTVRLKEVVYRGAQTHLYADLNGIQVAAFVPNADVRPIALEPGQELGLDWDGGSLVVLE